MLQQKVKKGLIWYLQHKNSKTPFNKMTKSSLMIGAALQQYS